MEHTIYFFVDFPRLWEIFKKYDINVIYLVDFQESASVISTLRCTHAHSYSAATHLQHQPFPFLLRVFMAP